MSEQNRQIQEKWDQKHTNAQSPGEIARVLSENLHLLPPQGDALDLACGRGANALQLARCGLNVQAWDISPVAIERLRTEADQLNLQLTAQVKDVTICPPEISSFDVVIVSHFLERNLAGAIERALRVGGVLFYQTFSQSSGNGPRTKSFYLKDNELLELFPNLKLRVYRNESQLGDLNLGWRGLAMMVAEK